MSAEPEEGHLYRNKKSGIVEIFHRGKFYKLVDYAGLLEVGEELIFNDVDMTVSPRRIDQ